MENDKRLANLQPMDKLSPEERLKRQRNGGIAAHEARKRRKTLKQNLELILSLPANDRAKANLASLGFDVDDDINNMMLVAASLFKQAINGNIRAIEKCSSGLLEEDLEIKRLKGLIEKQKVEIEYLKARAESERVKQAVLQGDSEDDGFIAALQESAEDDWSEYDQDSEV